MESSNISVITNDNVARTNFQLLINFFFANGLRLKRICTLQDLISRGTKARVNEALKRYKRVTHVKYVLAPSKLMADMSSNMSPVMINHVKSGWESFTMDDLRRYNTSRPPIIFTVMAKAANKMTTMYRGELD